MPEDVKPEVVQKTQKILGKYVKKPVLTEKLLKKPPFRFLHDIVNAVIKETGFLKGLYTEDELNSENVKEKDAKIVFLTKLIKAVKTITSTDLAARPSKIVAGLEAAETNVLLQTIGRALEKKLDSSEYVKQVNSSHIIANDKEKSRIKSDKEVKPTRKPAVGKDEKPTRTKSKEKLNADTPKSTDRSRKSRTGSDEALPVNKIKKKTTSKDDVKTSSRSKEDVKTSSRSKDDVKTSSRSKDDGKTSSRGSKEKIKENTIQVKENERKKEQTRENERRKSEEMKSLLEPEKNDAGKDSPREVSSELKTHETESTAAIGDVEAVSRENEEIRKKQRTPSASRPKSARPRSGDFNKENNKKTPEPAQMTTSTSSTISNRPKSSLRPPSVRPSSARPGAPRLRPDSALPMKEVVTLGKINVIVENFDKDADEEETVVIHSSPEVVENEAATVEVPEDNKGHLVEQILEQINETEGDDVLNKPKVDIDWQSEGIQSKDVTARETNNLRTVIQTLTKTANPLGKLLNYLHEDLETMHAELESWTSTKKQLFAEIGKQKKIRAELNKPLLMQLDNLNADIKKLEEEIVSARSNILRNEIKIQELMTK